MTSTGADWQRALARHGATIAWFKMHALVPDVGFLINGALILAGTSGDSRQLIVIRRARIGTTAWPIDWPDTDVRQVGVLDYDDGGIVMRPIDTMVDEILAAAHELAA